MGCSIFEGFRPDEKNKTGTWISQRNEENFALVTNVFTEPSTYKEAIKHIGWKNSMVEEYKEVIENNTWKLVYCPNNVKPIGWKCVYRINYGPNGDMEK